MLDKKIMHILKDVKIAYMTWKHTTSEKDFYKILINYGLSSLISHLKPKIEKISKDSFLLVIQFPIHSHSPKLNENFFMFLITPSKIISFSKPEPQDKYLKIINFLQTKLSKSNTKVSTFSILSIIIRSFYKITLDELEKIENEISIIQDKIFKGYEKQMVKAISIVATDIIKIEQTISYHDEIWKNFLLLTAKPNDKLNLKQIQSTFYQIKKRAEFTAKIISELRQTNDSLVSTKQNESMRIFTILAFITLPLSLVTGIFGMNFEYLPLAEHPFGFWFAILLMFLSVPPLILYFKHKNWL